MNKYWSRQLNSLSVYEAGEQPQDKSYIKLNTNENPYPPSPRVIETIRDFKGNELRLYPDPESRRLKQVIAECYGLEPGNVFTGNGSDEVIAHAYMAFFRQIYPVYFPDITYSFYPVFCGYFGIEYQVLPLTESFDIDTECFPVTNGGIIFPNPNAPTGKYTEVARIEALLNRNRDSVVIIDEAYIDFGGESCVSLIKEYPNLLLIQTISKSRSLAGLRVGYALGAPGLIDGLNIAKNSFNSYPLDRIASAAAIEAFLDTGYFQECTRRVMETRAWVSDKLLELSCEVVPSRANFILARHPSCKGRDLYEKLKEHGVLVRHFNLPRIEQYIRISIGTEEEMREFIRTLEEILYKKSEDRSQKSEC